MASFGGGAAIPDPDQDLSRSASNKQEIMR